MLNFIHFKQQPALHAIFAREITIDLTMTKAVINKCLDKTVLITFEHLRALAQQATLFRHCLSRQLGSRYNTLSIYFHTPIIETAPATGTDTAAQLSFCDVVIDIPWVANNATIAAKPNMRVFAACHDRGARHVCGYRYGYGNHYGVSPQRPPGPNLLDLNLIGRQLLCTSALVKLASGAAVTIKSKVLLEPLVFLKPLEQAQQGY